MADKMFPVFSIRINEWGHLEHRLVSATSAEEVPGVFKKFLEDTREQSKDRGFGDDETCAFIYNNIEWDQSDLMYMLRVQQVEDVFSNKEGVCWDLGR